MVNKKCANCGGMYEYNPKNKALKCVNCGSLKAIKSDLNIQSHNYLKEHEGYDNAWAKDVRQVKCESCGAVVVLNKFSIMNKCSYCGNTSLVDVKENAQVSPDSVIPFQFDRTEALTHFQEGLRKKHFIPNALKKKAPNVNLSSNYIGSYIFTGKASVKYSGVLEYETTSTNSKGETETHYHTKRVSGTTMHIFNNRAYECSTMLNQEELLHILPYNLKEQKGYKPEYLLGSSAEYSDKSVKVANNQLEYDLKVEITNNILIKYNCDRVKTLDLTIAYEQKDYVYCLLPTYVFNYKYKNKDYKTFMNGQTGKLGGNVPISTVKITFFVLFILALIAGIVGLILFI